MRTFLKPIFVFLFCYIALPLSAQEKITLDEIQKLFIPDDKKSRLIHFNGYWAESKSRSIFYTIYNISKNKRENLEIYVIVSHKNEQQKKNFQKWFTFHKMDLKYYEANYEEASYYFQENKAESYAIDHVLKCSLTFDNNPQKHKEQLLKFAIKQPKSNLTQTQNDTFAEELDNIISTLMNASMGDEKPLLALLAYIKTKGGVRHLTADSQNLLFKASRANNVRNMTEEQLNELIRLSFLQIEELTKNEGMNKTDFPQTLLALKNAKEYIKNEEETADDTFKVEGTFSPVEYKKAAPKKAIERITFEGSTYLLKVSHTTKIQGDDGPIILDTSKPIEKGELIEIEATGSIGFGSFGEHASPDGFANNVLKAYNRIPWMNHGALYGGIISPEEKQRNASTAFEAILFGSQKVFTAPETGYLILLFNDKNYKNNAGGYFDIKIKRYTKIK